MKTRRGLLMIEDVETGLTRPAPTKPTHPTSARKPPPKRPEKRLLELSRLWLKP